MPKNTGKHWTADNPKKFLYRISTDFMIQIQEEMERKGVTQQDMAKALGVTPSAVSQTINDPGNLTLVSMLKYAQALGLKISAIAYDDGDAENAHGPILADVFKRCWEHCGQPADLFDIDELQETAINDAESQLKGVMVALGGPQSNWHIVGANIVDPNPFAGMEITQWTSLQSKSPLAIESSLVFS